MQVGVQRTVDAFGLILGGLGDLGRSIVTSPTTAPPASGPVGIAVELGDILWSLGPIYVLYMAALLSANLALVNVLPFPPLDGGRILMILLKAIPGYGKKISMRAEQVTYAVGFVALFTFLIWITVFDVARQVGRQPVTSPDQLRPVRRPTVSVDVGGVLVGSAHPVVVQSMTNTDTADPDSTAIQVARLAHAGSQLVRVTVNTDEAAAAVPEMVGEGRATWASTCRSSATSTTTGTSCSWTTPRWRPRSTSTGSTRATSARSTTTRNFPTIVRAAIEHGKPVRIGVNWGIARPAAADRADGGERDGSPSRATPAT